MRANFVSLINRLGRLRDHQPDELLFAQNPNGQAFVLQLMRFRLLVTHGTVFTDDQEMGLLIDVG